MYVATCTCSWGETNIKGEASASRHNNLQITRVAVLGKFFGCTVYSTYVHGCFYCSVAGSVPGCSHTTVRALEASSTTLDELALGLADILFTKDELSSSLVTQKEGRNLLDPDRVEGIRCT